MARLQSLDRGLRALQVISSEPRGVRIAALAAQLDVDRAVAYRLVETLEAHALVARGPGGRVRLGAGAVVLAGKFQPQLIHAAEPILQELADVTATPAFLTMEQGDDDCIPMLVAEPVAQGAPLQVGYRIGMRHGLDRGANGIAILALRPPHPNEPEEVTLTRKRGYSITSGQLQPGATGVAAGFFAPGPVGASVGVVAINEVDAERFVSPVVSAAARLVALSNE
jgi:DNA-binding IclR family transcriptional regulator